MNVSEPLSEGMQLHSETVTESHQDNRTEQFGLLRTEQVNPDTADLDTLTTLEMVRRMNSQDRDVPDRVGAEVESIARAIDLAADHLSRGGRLIYAGAGTSGRLGFLDASECPPTFGISRDKVLAIIAGGKDAVFAAFEGVEDDAGQAGHDLADLGLSHVDVVMAIASSGRTPYCIGALQYAAEVGAGRIALSCNKQAVLSDYAQVAIEVDSGPETIMGSTRLKAGTAQKLVLNMISTLTMVRLGHVYRNLMVNVRGLNVKLSNRMLRIFTEATGNPDQERARQLLQETGGALKPAIVMELAGVSYRQATQALDIEDGYVRRALDRLAASTH